MKQAIAALKKTTKLTSEDKSNPKMSSSARSAGRKSYLKDGKGVIVTTSWDDGHKLDIKITELLKKYKISSTFYIAPKNIEWDKKDLLTDEEIKIISKDFEIGGHTITHPDLTSISTSEAKKEIYESKIYYEKLLGKKINSFCYPKGYYNPKVKNIVKNAGFTYARTIERFQFDLSGDILASGTSIHAFNQYRDTIKIAKYSNWHLARFVKNMNWKFLAMDIFDQVLESGGVYHLWGHSWLINMFRDWGKLESVLSYISRKPGVIYIENKDLLKFYK